MSWGEENTQLSLLLAKLPCKAGICGYCRGEIKVFAGGRLMNWLFHDTRGIVTGGQPADRMRKEDRNSIINAFQAVADTQEHAECDFSCIGQEEQWKHLEFRYLEQWGDIRMILCTMSDITRMKKAEQQLSSYKHVINQPNHQPRKVLIVDDQRLNRDILKEIFQNQFRVLEAANGKEAIEVLEANRNEVSVILLDLMMPVMDGREFLEYKKEHAQIADIPVVVITADSSRHQQVNTLALGVDDYIVKPFVVEVVLRRVNNVLESHMRFREVLREYNMVLEKTRVDPLTKLYNRSAAEEFITRILHTEPDCMHALIMMDVDKFKVINDTYGHRQGDCVLVWVADKLRSSFRDTDIVARFGGDEFCMFMRAISSENTALSKAMELCAEINQMQVGEGGCRLSVSMGIAVSSESEAISFDVLYKNADLALYESKKGGRNQANLYRASLRKEDDG